MTDAPKPRSFIVVLNFAPPGPLTVGSWIAPDEAFAAALAAISAARQFPGEWPLVNCLVLEESAEMLRTRLRAIEGKPVGDVVSLVQPGPSQSQRAAELLQNANPRPTDVDGRCPHDWMNGECAWCHEKRKPWQPDDPCDPVA